MDLVPIEKFKKWDQDLKDVLRIWRSDHLKYLSEFKSDQACVIFYEELQENVIKSLKPCVNFLGFEINETLEKCILKHQEGNFKRRQRNNNEVEKILSYIPKDLQEEAEEIYSRMKSALKSRYMDKDKSEL